MFKALITGATIAIAATLSSGLAYADQPNILIMGEDADTDSVPRGSRIFNQVVMAMQTELQVMGFRVYDETAVSMDITDPNRVRRSDAELITVARRIQDVPIDVITVFEIFASTEDNPYSDIMDLRLRIPGRLINVATGQALGNYEVNYEVGELPPLPPGCDERNCILEHIGAEARRIAADVASVLAVNLDYLSPAAASEAPNSTITGSTASDNGCTGLTTAYTLTFRNFDQDQLFEVEEYLAAFQGYDHHRPTRSSMSETTYWYETCTEVARLRRNLSLMVESMGLETRIDFVGNRIEIDNLRRPATR